MSADRIVHDLRATAPGQHPLPRPFDRVACKFAPRRALLRDHARPDRIDGPAVPYFAADARNAAGGVGDVEGMGGEIVGTVLQHTPGN